MKKKIAYLTITAVIGMTAFFVGKFTAQPEQPETVQAEETTPETEKSFNLLEMTVKNGGLYLEYTDGNNFYSHWIPSENLADHDLINVNDIKGWETYKRDDLVGIELQASDWGYVIEKEAYTVDATANRTE